MLQPDSWVHVVHFPNLVVRPPARRCRAAAVAVEYAYTFAVLQLVCMLDPMRMRPFLFRRNIGYLPDDSWQEVVRLTLLSSLWSGTFVNLTGP